MKRTLQGTIVSDKMNKTAVVAVATKQKHPKYLKYYTVTRRFKAHNEGDQYKVGQVVVIEEARPMSKDKRWVVTGLVEGAPQPELSPNNELQTESTNVEKDIG
ncbi:MAG: 30S ribosomal protein S17 [Candidatus Harrisonbacteria bacterium CG10_big_fil_rev_8_21_14_0_10_49_15]|uniref:Small ribosomal subunit protein uS17 n=1 Tax=Candidatus Harrisonbacteria bacterium CG10_big_fil_rev_8_21_14_0_10_49_15 TaxID=1974587 RepID=A0A2H0UN19_9BACT|nr:MAG: 30S ribosomal protein S17 [Candidatus Harrisonbacteria bacterium CG10_big_fil_rev_8_21_14_0_10_49_15]